MVGGRRRRSPVRAILDTHVLIWWLNDAAKLSPRAHELLADRSNDLIVSAATIWELSIKERLGKLPPIGPRLPALIDRNGFARLAIDHRHARLAGELSSAHRDPFDRMLAAQSAIEGVGIMSADNAFESLGVVAIW
jgi:PIN domain nuclease of toxin-antitoxin system